MQRGIFRCGPRVTADEMQAANRHVEFVAVCVFQQQEFNWLRIDIQRDKSAVPAHAVIFMHNWCANLQVCQFADNRIGIAPGSAPARSLAWLFHADVFGTEDLQAMLRCYKAPGDFSYRNRYGRICVYECMPAINWYCL